MTTRFDYFSLPLLMVCITLLSVSPDTSNGQDDGNLGQVKVSKVAVETPRDIGVDPNEAVIVSGDVFVIGGGPNSPAIELDPVKLYVGWIETTINPANDEEIEILKIEKELVVPVMAPSGIHDGEGTPIPFGPIVVEAPGRGWTQGLDYVVTADTSKVDADNNLGDGFRTIIEGSFHVNPTTGSIIDGILDIFGW